MGEREKGNENGEYTWNRNIYEGMLRLFLVNILCSGSGVTQIVFVCTHLGALVTVDL